MTNIEKNVKCLRDLRRPRRQKTVNVEGASEAPEASRGIVFRSLARQGEIPQKQPFLVGFRSDELVIILS